MITDTLLRLAYGFKLAVLVPVVASLHLLPARPTLIAFDDKVANIDALRLLLAALWLGVLVCSAVRPAPLRRSCNRF